MHRHLKRASNRRSTRVASRASDLGDLVYTAYDYEVMCGMKQIRPHQKIKI